GGNAVWLCLAIFGLSALAARFSLAFIIVKWLGAAYLMLLAWKLWRSSPAGGPAQAADRQPTGIAAGLSGAALTLGNPKAGVFFGAVLPSAFDLAALDGTGIAVVLALGIAIDLSVQGIYLALAGRARSLIRSPWRLRAVHRMAAGVIAGSAIGVAV